MDKTALRAALLHQLESDLALQTAAALTSRDEATSEESKAENKYDMRAQEAAYLGPRAGGTEFSVGDRRILVVTPASPLGRQLLGRRRGDTVTLPGAKRPLAIASVA